MVQVASAVEVTNRRGVRRLFPAARWRMPILPERERRPGHRLASHTRTMSRSQLPLERERGIDGVGDVGEGRAHAVADHFHQRAAMRLDQMSSCCASASGMRVGSSCHRRVLPSMSENSSVIPPGCAVVNVHTLR